jgi:ElaB/YqjD/DUF883 family membrane-anchored ribosome-binding protein
MVSPFGGGGGISKNKKLKEEVEKIDKDIKKLLKELREDPVGWHPKKNKEYRKLIEKILKEIEEHKKSLHKLYGLNQRHFSEIDNLEHYLRDYYKIVEAATKPHTLAFPPGMLEAKWHTIQDLWNKHKYELHRYGIVK